MATRKKAATEGITSPGQDLYNHRFALTGLHILEEGKTSEEPTINEAFAEQVESGHSDLESRQYAAQMLRFQARNKGAINSPLNVWKKIYTGKINEIKEALHGRDIQHINQVFWNSYLDDNSRGKVQEHDNAKVYEDGDVQKYLKIVAESSQTHLVGVTRTDLEARLNAGVINSISRPETEERR